jgi:hypothetical protein
MMRMLARSPTGLCMDHPSKHPSSQVRPRAPEHQRGEEQGVETDDDENRADDY